MRSSRLVPVLGWCAATLTSVALASVAMLPVLRTATPDGSALVSVDQLRDAGAAEPTPQPSASVAAADPEPEPSAPATPSRSRDTKPGGTPSRSSATPTPARTTAPAESTTTTEDGWTVTTDGDGTKSYVRSFRVDGGSAVIRMTEDKVEVVTATPSDGYSVATVQNSPDNLAVYFNEVNHSFIIHAVWNVDKPFVEVSEIGK
ncbi:DNA mismatch repair protein MutL [Actinoplanes sp. NPDC049599]|uniref:DNA mismatch repair protein MutL n=1 Tax=Actinoplanes sp. NPDC049599 TaxID=3363903 RepID=UPI0037B64E4B